MFQDLTAGHYVEGVIGKGKFIDLDVAISEFNPLLLENFRAILRSVKHVHPGAII